MKVTNEMLEAAMKKAVEAGLLPRHACNEDVSINQELIRIVLQAALDTSHGGQVRQLQVVKAEAGQTATPSHRRFAQILRTPGTGSYAL